MSESACVSAFLLFAFFVLNQFDVSSARQPRSSKHSTRHPKRLVPALAVLVCRLAVIKDDHHTAHSQPGQPSDMGDAPGPTPTTGRKRQTLPHPHASCVPCHLWHPAARMPLHLRDAPPSLPLPLRQFCCGTSGRQTLPCQGGQWAICKCPNRDAIAQARSTALMDAISEPAPLCGAGTCAQGLGEWEERRREGDQQGGVGDRRAAAPNTVLCAIASCRPRRNASSNCRLFVLQPPAHHGDACVFPQSSILPSLSFAVMGQVHYAPGGSSIHQSASSSKCTFLLEFQLLCTKILRVHPDPTSRIGGCIGPTCRGQGAEF
jgi:hypothetical protein